ncbi:sensor histidine kinase [Deinococcus metallilatus]|uniref:Sensor histidine kinase n=1 Tax=Deinococcus metallilatus TaxID=1211322 RepID=A0AAJ5F7H3_9DEIO|nr:sensor histidine kinase [Deinococcus metallilatus]MBB5296292.1 two-component system sensor histidine kinase DesK [Deinococcus metallilatus]QBY10024.1 sensor histidine kinase [Deinococcus metallilatus]RXJ08748.1 sensor histidine kinase [Deinococcus metallilatus]TLK25222.1 sensor histidine kinase [Deinococcus metallilatus]GMA14796.1 two-component sensor histidine kinase [Deinococcus metallilatus]
MKVFRQRLTVWDVFPLLWLMFLGFPVIGFFGEARTPAQAALFWGLLAGFLAVYWRVFMRPHSERWALIGWAYTLLTYLLLFPVIGGTASAFLIYGGSLIGMQGSVALALWLAFLNAQVMVLPLWTGQYGTGDLGWLVPNVVFTLVAAYANHASYRQRITSDRLAQVQAEKEALAADAERERIARDLHDLLGHTLSVIVLKSELASKLAERDPARAAGEIREVERISREALSEVRAAVSGYRGSGLKAELARAKVALDAAGVRLEYGGQPGPLPPEVEHGMSMVLREAVTNVVRHARASECRVSITRAGGYSRLEIVDDGVGGAAPEGTGLTSMRERVRALGGEFTRDGTAGTRLVASFPGAEGSGPRAGSERLSGPLPSSPRRRPQ